MRPGKKNGDKKRRKGANGTREKKPAARHGTARRPAPDARPHAAHHRLRGGRLQRHPDGPAAAGRAAGGDLAAGLQGPRQLHQRGRRPDPRRPGARHESAGAHLPRRPGTLAGGRAAAGGGAAQRQAGHLRRLPGQRRRAQAVRRRAARAAQERGRAGDVPGRVARQPDGRGVRPEAAAGGGHGGDGRRAGPLLGPGADRAPEFPGAPEPRLADAAGRLQARRGGPSAGAGRAGRAGDGELPGTRRQPGHGAQPRRRRAGRRRACPSSTSTSRRAASYWPATAR